MRLLLLAIFFGSCSVAPGLTFSESGHGGSDFFRQAVAMKWKQRDSLALLSLLDGNMPTFLGKFVPIHVSIIDSSNGKKIDATYYVMPDYISIGNDDDWARIPLTPMAAQQVADKYDCFLPTRKMVDDIYRAAKVKLEPIPMYAFRDSTITMYQHHLIIEGQRQLRKGLIAGIKKDIVISSKVSADKRPDREAIYGWHKPDGSPIQPLYTGHINWWVDYSHGIRLVHRKIRINKTWMDYKNVLNDPILKRLLCDEMDCSFASYPK